MNRHPFLIASALVLTGAFTLVSSSPAAAKGKHAFRQIKKGTGNCIFSKQALPYEKEETYKGVTTKFSSGDKINARCYWAKPLEKYKAMGKSTNELRDAPSRYRVELAVYPDGVAKKANVKSLRAPPSNPDKKAAAPLAVAAKSEADKVKKADTSDKPARSLPRVIVRVIAVGSETWDQRDYDLDPAAKRCLFPPEFGMQHCLDINAAVIDQAAAVNKALPYTADVCLNTYVVYENVTGGEKKQPLSAGCFAFTATSLGLPPAP